ncbi:MAG: hypothetical protein DRJ40_05060 [Thermoprotei archaeon]|nr:MAG: hypothetical protein DRJ40_04465 [Thermoprotei archaeon]RLE56768.1 MAG: hypothetical protein DRJ40_05060 [Thermoprotei archaeon]
MKPPQALKYICVWLALILGIATGYVLDLNYSSYVLLLVGYIIFGLGMYIHYLSHRAHPRAHRGIEEIDYVATHGIYSWIRHPGYLGLSLAFYGLAIAFGSVPGLAIATVLTLHHYYLAVREERLMIEKFGTVYIKYMEEVPDRFIPVRKIAKHLKKRLSPKQAL